MMSGEVPGKRIRGTEGLGKHQQPTRSLLHCPPLLCFLSLYLSAGVHVIHIPKVHSRFAWTVLAQVLAAMSEIDVNRKDSADGLSADDRKKLELRKALAQRLKDDMAV